MNEQIKEHVRERYAGVARAVSGTSGTTGRPRAEGATLTDGAILNESSCCGAAPSSCCAPSAALLPEPADSAVGGALTCGSYTVDELGQLPEEAVRASLGCGNPVSLATLSPGEVVLDLGSGGGIDVLLSARRVAPGGKAYGLDMTDEMLALARANQQKAGVENAEFLKGDIEAIPLPDSHVDVILSNCVVNLSPDKDRTLAEAYRVLKPGGRLAISDIVFAGDKGGLPEDALRQVELWAGCVAGALGASEYEEKLLAAGFTDVSVEVTHVYSSDDVAESGLESSGDSERLAEQLQSARIAGAFVRARKPAAKAEAEGTENEAAWGTKRRVDR